MAIIITAPNEDYSVKGKENKKLFLAGSITGADDWQTDMIQMLDQFDCLTIFNPRRTHFDIKQKNIQEEQIVWEYNHLNEVDFICFWFAKNTISPTTLYELGKYGNNKNKILSIGVDPEYERKDDVIIQSKLAGYSDYDIHIGFNHFKSSVSQRLIYIFKKC